MKVFCSLRFWNFEARILFYLQSLGQEQIFTVISVFVSKLWRFKELEFIRALTVKWDVWTKFCPNFNFTVKALIMSNSLYRPNFRMKADMNVKICSYHKLCTQNKMLASKFPNPKQQKTSVFASLILKRWIMSRSQALLKAFLRGPRENS